MSALRRRRFRWSPLLTTVVLALSLAISPGHAAADTSSRVERSTDFGSGWKFALANRTGITDPTGAFANAAAPGYDDSSWRRVDLPHDWSIELDPTDAAGTSSGTGFLQGGLGWYRKDFTLPKSLAGKRISVEFDGVYMDSSVYLNGKPIASHAYGYTGFPVDLTSLVTADGKTRNVLAVQVRNQLPSSRWYSGSGIYRNVHLVVTDPVHVSRHGVFATTPDLARTYAAGHGDVQVTTSVIDESGTGSRAKVVSTISDANGRPVGTDTADIELGSQAKPRRPTSGSLVRRCGRSRTRTCTRCGPTSSSAAGPSIRPPRESGCAGRNSIRSKDSRSTAGTPSSRVSISTTTRERWVRRSTRTRCTGR